MGNLLITHDIVLRGSGTVLRPMTEEDWPALERWNADAAVLSFSDGNDRESYSPEEVRGIYRQVSETGLCFMIERDGKPVGECWLQRMNLPEILKRHPGLDLRRIDIAIGEKELWGRGLGTEAIGLLARLGFERERADMIWGCGVWSGNPRSLMAFAKNGFAIDEFQLVEGHGGKGIEYNLAVTRAEWERFHSGPRPLVVRRASAADRSAVLDILTEAAEWLLSRGTPQWEEHVTRRDRLERWVDEGIAGGEAWLAGMEGEPAGTFLLSGPSGEFREIWPDASERERYLWKLAVRRRFAGLGVRLLRRAELIAVAQGARAVRLDCVASGPIPNLPRYYERSGYAPRGTMDFHGWKLARFERLLA